MPLNKAEFIYHKNIETYTKDNYVICSDCFNNIDDIHYHDFYHCEDCGKDLCCINAISPNNLSSHDVCSYCDDWLCDPVYCEKCEVALHIKCKYYHELECKECLK